MFIFIHKKMKKLSFRKPKIKQKIAYSVNKKLKKDVFIVNQLIISFLVISVI